MIRTITLLSLLASLAPATVHAHRGSAVDDGGDVAHLRVDCDGPVAVSTHTGSTPTATTERFVAVDIYLEAHAPVSAYQIEVTVASGESTIVGVEGGDVAPFDQPPYYDPKALQEDRIVLAAYSTDATLPKGRHRVATLHMHEVGAAAAYQVRLHVAADAQGNPVTANPSVARRAPNAQGD